MKNEKLIVKKIALFLLLIISSFTLFACTDEKTGEINTNLTDNFKLEASYEGKSFIDDGIGIVTLTQNVDGDTCHLRDVKKNYNFTARFHNINTPESTGKIDAWGKAASAFVANILSKATLIVCESDDLTKGAQLDTTNKRYMAYLWYRTDDTSDLRLLNLEIVEQCYSRFTSNADETKYGDIFNQAQDKSLKVAKRVYGERDPEYDYSLTVTEMTIAYLRSHFDEYSFGSKLKMTARVVRIVADNLYLEDVEKTNDDITGNYDTAGIYLFSGYGTGLGKLTPGTIITFRCQATNNDIYGKQLTNPQRVVIESETSEYEIREYSGTERIDLESFEGLVINVKNVTVLSKTNPNEEGAFTVKVRTTSGQEFNVRIDGDATPKIEWETISVGDVRDIIGGVSRYVSQYSDDEFQIMLGNYSGDGANDFALAQEEINFVLITEAQLREQTSVINIKFRVPSGVIATALEDLIPEFEAQ